MRLHHLEVTAFGPFAETSTVDFDALSEAGLFLLTGATGAGKTSVLDAVCFALYGEVPGDRQTAKRLRSDQAAAGVAPQVTLELSLGGRRFRVTRSPAWERPKKRGAGLTTEQASVRFSERRDDGWTLLSSRLDETGHLVGHLVGMNLAQFCQVAMLPQGRFQAFLRARSDERHQLLQQLFRTSRFEQVERWLRERRKSLRHESARHHEVVADLVSRVSEASESPLPDTWDPHDLLRPAAGGDLERWATTHRARGTAAAGEAVARAGRATQAEQAARGTLDHARRLVELQSAHRDALAERASLDEAEPDHRARVAALTAARRAAGVVPLHRVADQQSRTVASALAASEERLQTVSERLGTPASQLGRAALDGAQRRARDEAARARALLPREATLHELRAAVAVTTTEVGTLGERRAALAARLSELPPAVAAARADHAAALAAQHYVAAARADVVALAERRQAAERAVALASELAEARVLHTAAVDAVHQVKERWLRLQEERLSGMAAEIAGALAVGNDCPVCGSVEHPRLAPSRPGAPDAAAEREARRLVDDAELDRHARDERVRDLQTQLALAEQQAGADPESLPIALATAEAAVSGLAATAALLDRRAALLERLEDEQARLTAEQEAVAMALTAARAGLAARQAEADALGRELADALAGSGSTTTADLVDDQERLADDCAAALEALSTLGHAREAADTAAARAEEAAAAAGFGSLRLALDAALDDDAQAGLAEEVRAHEAAAARVDGLLADPALRAAANVATPDLDDLVRRHASAEAELAEARTDAALAEARARRLSGLDDELREALAAWTPVRDELALATRMAALADGTSADNRLQMRLSGYVLAWRLSQVVDAANQRLGRMSDQRYSLEHTGRRGAGETRGGLSLLVRDDWSGETRDPATLSGGETFVVSLALALGLADVIAHEVGGTDLDTLFVDEGFGSLDADTLDDVMDTLDSLRDGGRVVGVVSHVPEMRDRIPAQLRVTKARSGSSLAISASSTA